MLMCIILFSWVLTRNDDHTMSKMQWTWRTTPSWLSFTSIRCGARQWKTSSRTTFNPPFAAFKTLQRSYSQLENRKPDRKPPKVWGEERMRLVLNPWMQGQDSFLSRGTEVSTFQQRPRTSSDESKLYEEMKSRYKLIEMVKQSLLIARQLEDSRLLSSKWPSYLATCESI